MNAYRDYYIEHTVPWLYEHDPDSIRPDLLRAYEDHLEILAENRAEWALEETDDDAVSDDTGAASSYDPTDVVWREQAVAAYNGDLPWNLFSETYYYDHKDEVEALAA